MPPPIAARSLASIVRRTVQPCAEVADEVGVGDEHVVEEDLVEVIGAGHLPQRSHVDARVVHVEREAGQPGVARLRGIGPRDEKREVTAAGTGGPHLLAGDRPPAVNRRRRRPGAREVRPRARFGEQLAPPLLTAQDRGQILQPLLV